MKKSALIMAVAKVPLDFLMVFIGFFAGHFLRLHSNIILDDRFSLNANQLIAIPEYIKYSVLFSIIFIAIFALNGAYKIKNTDSFSNELQKFASSTLVWILSIMSYFFIIGESSFSRLAFGFSVASAIILLTFGRLMIRLIKIQLLKANIGRKKVIIFSWNKTSEQLALILQKNIRYELIGYIGDKSDTSSVKHLGDFSDFAKIIKEQNADEIINTGSDCNSETEQDLIEFCFINNVLYSFTPDIQSIEKTFVDVSMVSGMTIIHLKTTPLEGWGKIAKRIFDIFASALGIIILMPLLIVVGILIKIDSKGPVLFSKLPNGEKANRVGKNGKLFCFYKFRTMTQNAHDLRAQLEQKNHRTGPLFKIKNDPRVTKFGKFLRKTSIDELPQLWNVLKGDLSLVGPRAHLPEEVEKYEKHHKFLLTIKPGITGLSQISGRSDLSFEQEVKLESAYISQWSFLLDIKILLKTVLVVISGKAAD